MQSAEVPSQSHSPTAAVRKPRACVRKWQLAMRWFAQARSLLNYSIYLCEMKRISRPWIPFYHCVWKKLTANKLEERMYKNAEQISDVICMLIRNCSDSLVCMHYLRSSRIQKDYYYIIFFVINQILVWRTLLLIVSLLLIYSMPFQFHRMTLKNGEVPNNVRMFIQPTNSFWPETHPEGRG